MNTQVGNLRLSTNLQTSQELFFTFLQPLHLEETIQTWLESADVPSILWSSPQISLTTNAEE